MDYTFNNNNNVGLYSNGFEIKGVWDGKQEPLTAFLDRVNRMRNALKWLEAQKNMLPDDLEVIKNALKE